MEVADRIVVMNQGRIEQAGSAREVFERPRTEFVARFIGAHNVIDTPAARIAVRTDRLRLADTDPVHATITHDDRDEYVLTLHGEGETNASLGVDATHADENSETLRTGAHFTAGPWTLVFAREEFADHGRPYGGRAGGEYSDQPLQPPRPDYDEGEER